MGIGKKWRWFTIMFVPHYEGSTVSIRLPLVAVQVGVSLLIVAFIILLSFINTYRQRLHDAHEARVLREVNRVQQEEIERFESQTLILKEQVDEMEQVVDTWLDRLGIPPEEEEITAEQPD
ncbi:MAG: hypothetical protein GX973_05430 [Firmicutes bacterium]|nr:hypothetical protein [Bacillota bacterium]